MGEVKCRINIHGNVRVCAGNHIQAACQGISETVSG